MIIIPTEKRFDWRYAPTCLFVIVLLNVILFFFYQSEDDAKIEQALERYQQQNYLAIEWPLLQDYLRNRREFDQLDTLRQLYQEKAFEQVVVLLLHQPGFYDYLRADPFTYFGPKQANDWLEYRPQVDQIIHQLSYNAYGLIPNQMRPVTLISHQFLHGDTLHLLGNMFFLIICGFAVEAALGHWRFLLFYLCSGVTAGVAYAALDFSSGTTLVGASGAISGVMAMYLGVFKLRKIEFFYWFYVFVGYIRAPAMILLPFYIGKELLDFYTNPHSNVAFLAHAGGFGAGTLLMLANGILSPKSLNVQYLEQDQNIDPVQVSLAKIYDDIEQFRFDSALRNTQAAIKEFGSSFRLAELEYQLSQLKGHDVLTLATVKLLVEEADNATQLQKQAQLFMHANAELPLSREQICKLGIRLCDCEDLKFAELAFLSAKTSGADNYNLNVFAKRLSAAFTAAKNSAKAKHYQNLSAEFLGAAR